MPREKLSDQMAYPPRAMRLDRAAAYLGISDSTFLRLVDDGTLPQPVRLGGAVTWDRYALDAAYNNLANPGENTVHKRLRELK
jgi:excisionase family DNA binding protein